MIGTDAHRIVHKKPRQTPGSRLRRALTVLLVATIASSAAAQASFVIHGVVLNPSGDPVSGASVAIQGRYSVATDAGYLERELGFEAAIAV